MHGLPDEREFTLLERFERDLQKIVAQIPRLEHIARQIPDPR